VGSVRSVKGAEAKLKSIRGNVGTRVRKVQEGQYDAAVLAAAGLQRLDLTEVVTQWLPFDLMLPAPGQGALAVQCRADDAATLELLAAIDDADVRAAVTAERTFLGQLGGGCSAPIAAYAVVEEPWPQAALTMQALVATGDGRRLIRVNGRGKDARALGTRLAQAAMRKGAADILSTLEDGTASSLPLQGKRIVVTRARHQAQSLSDKLTELGATPVVIPAIRIAPMPDTQPLDRAMAALSDYDWVIFTSTNGVEIFWQWLEMAGLDNSIFNAVKVAAVGPATARALRQHAVQPDFVPDEFVSEATATGLGDDLTGQHILLPRAEIGREKLVQALVARGAHVDDVPSYRTLPAAMNAADLAELERGVDAVTFTSGSTARNFIAAVKERVDGETLSFFENTIIACIGPVTAEATRELGLDVDVVATEYTTGGLVEALATYFKGDNTRGAHHKG
jgi:uroporphyrinogen-III synthase